VLSIEGLVRRDVDAWCADDVVDCRADRRDGQCVDRSAATDWWRWNYSPSVIPLWQPGVRIRGPAP
jgi:hypothetical protein